MFKFSHRFFYGVLAILYAGSCLGLDKTIVTARVSVVYAAFAFKP